MLRTTGVADSLPSLNTTSLPSNASDPKKLELDDGIRVTTDQSDGIRVTSNTSDGIRVTSNASDGIRVTPAEESGPSRPKSLALEPMPLPPSNVAGMNPSTTAGNNVPAPATTGEEKKTAPTVHSSKPTTSKPAATCNHKHNNANAKELKKLMGHDCGKPKAGARSQS